MKNETTTATIPQRFIFEDKEIDFEITGSDVMVNATQMAKIFNKEVFQFTRIEGTKSFLESCLKPQNCGLLGVENEEDLIISVQKSGTWMHRVLAIKFAAWLDSDFEVWVYNAVDEILFGHYREMEDMLRRSAETRNRIDSLREELREDERFSELESLEVLDKQYQRVRSRKTTSQLELFRSITK